MKARMDCMLLHTVRVQNVKLESRSPVTLNGCPAHVCPARHLRASTTGQGQESDGPQTQPSHRQQPRLISFELFFNANRYRLPLLIC